ncbi:MULTISPECIES: protein translocase subunit SecD [unclassified Pseudoalteromonas]|uniref:protein translocase subunit SecD n=1 Tax=unclassified Pseudoalteromonas TaxID=194690 RepID=UPI0011099448|nr:MULTISPECIES: protein translocase subunit SecD [unclassified Pseudoalteromonas]TMN82767.1 protein translocase subunit SecD [Pseudoalteromonas sp. S410]TMN92656.1 protein translocase subunit SecD [Pseudoalteromonas sp. S408]TMN97552.1 protein translocase subunit SecD [Pseudoalteromonas sp. S409]TMO00981.1 protein translocase subunit SecD [Pseudoalteromonas sp. S407]TMO11557.1 protein translocase subunit SecD [Pseudoalteromonas sp. S186]
MLSVKKDQKPFMAKFKLSYIAMLIVLILLAISALPNLYPNKSWLHVNSAPHSEIQVVPSTKALVTFLNNQGLKVEQGLDKQSTINILLNEPTKSAQAQAAIKAQYPNTQVKIVEHATSPPWLQNFGLSPIKLGLDLNGGVLFVLDVDLDKAVDEQLVSAYQQAKSIIIKQKAHGLKAQQTKHGFEINALPNAVQKLTSVIDELQSRFANLAVTTTNNGNVKNAKFSYSEQGRSDFDKEVMSQTLTTLRSRIEELGITEAVTQRQGKQRIRIELPGVQDPTEAKRIIGATASLGFYQLKEVGGQTFNMQSGGTVNLDPVPIFTGDHINNANIGRDDWGKPLVQLSLDGQGGDAMSAFSKANIGKPMATVYSEYSQNASGETVKKSEVINVANIAQHLSSRFSITNMKSQQAAADLALLLRAGSLTAPVTIVHEQTIGPSLGSENISKGLAALMLGMGITLAFMALWYRRLGLIANVALLLNLTSLVGLMSLLPGVVLTLPGIAGLVLTIGMAVDTNVIIFERIKEERRKGRTPYQAIQEGYKQAAKTIFDANITTMITALILYGIGYGPVKGFAITLALGLITSVFTGVYVSKVLSQTLYLKLAKKAGVNAHA